MTNPHQASQALRLIDANANRAAEGLRTLEDVARLVREDALSTEQIKNLRHQLADAVAHFPRQERLAARNTLSDAGTEITAQQELQRDSWQNIIAAATERTTQSLRCLEEFSKLTPSVSSEKFKALRYQAYDVLAGVELRLRREPFPTAARLYLLIDCSLPLESFGNALASLSSHGVDVFQLRDKTADGGKLLQYANQARETLTATNAHLIINDRVDIAIACQADGVHVGQDDIPMAEVRRLAPPEMWIGVSTHTHEQAIAAEAAGADYIGCGPTFQSKTKQFNEFAGPEFLKAVASSIQLPFFAIGGINDSNVEQVIASGCTRIAVSNAIHAASKPADTARFLADTLANG